MEYYPLTIFQQSIYDMLDLMDESYSYLAFLIQFREKLKTAPLQEAINRVIMKNDGLRIRLVIRNKEVRQYVSDYAWLDIGVHDFSHSENTSIVNDWMQKETEKREKLYESDLFAFTILELHEGTACFAKIRHVLCDGWASALIKQQIEEEYLAITGNAAVQNDQRPSFVKHVKEHLEYLHSDRLGKNIDYWLSRFRPPLDATCFKSDFIASESMRCQSIEFVAPEGIQAKLDRFCKERCISILVFYLSIMALDLARVNSGSNVILGTFFHNRLTPEEQKTIGQFATTLALRIEIDRKMSFSTLVRQVAGELKGAIKNNYLSSRMIQSLRGEAIKRGLIPEGLAAGPGASGGSGFEFHGVDTVVSFEVYQKTGDIRYVMPPEEFCQLLFLMTVVGNRLMFEFQYWQAAFQKNEIEQIYRTILDLTELVTAKPEKSLSELVFESTGR